MSRSSVSKDKKSSPIISTKWRLEEAEPDEKGYQLGAELTTYKEMDKKKVEALLRNMFFSIHSKKDPNQKMVLKKMEKEQNAEVRSVRRS